MRLLALLIPIALAAGCRPKSADTSGGAKAGGPQAAAPAILRAVRSSLAPKLDGNADDAAWARAPVLVVKVSKGKGDKRVVQDVRLRAIHDGASIYLLAIWQDSTADESHHSWTWDVKAGQWVKGEDLEDRFAIEFPMGDSFHACMLSGVPYRSDVWHWKAARTNPAGYAHDKHHIISLDRTSDKAAEYKIGKDKWVYVDRRADAGVSPFRAVPAPAAPIAPQNPAGPAPAYGPRDPTGSQADIRARGRHARGRWTLELERALDTRHEDDTKFEVGGTYRAAIAVFDHESDEDHRTSKLILLKIER